MDAYKFMVIGLRFIAVLIIILLWQVCDFAGANPLGAVFIVGITGTGFLVFMETLVPLEWLTPNRH